MQLEVVPLEVEVEVHLLILPVEERVLVVLSGLFVDQRQDQLVLSI